MKEGNGMYLSKADFNRSRGNKFTIEHGSLATRFKASFDEPNDAVINIKY